MGTKPGQGSALPSPEGSGRIASELRPIRRRSSHRTTHGTTRSSSVAPCLPLSTPSLEPAALSWISAAHLPTSTSHPLNMAPQPGDPRTVKGAKGENVLRSVSDAD